MIYLLFAVLIIITVNAYMLTGRDILSPFIIVCGMFTLSTFFAVIMTPAWNLQLSAITIVVIVVGIVMFGFGEFTVRWVYEKDRNFKSDSKQNANEKEDIRIAPWKTVLVLAGLGVLTVLYFQKIYSISLLAGNDKGFSGMLEYARILIIQQGINPGFLLNQLFRVSTCIAYLYIFVILYRRIYSGIRKFEILYYLPIVLYLFLAFLSTSRTYFTQITIYALIIGFLLYYKKGKRISVKNRKIIRVGTISIVLFFTFFSVLGLTSGKSQDSGVIGMFDILSYYIGGSISALDNYLNNPPVGSGFFGSETLYIVYNTLNTLGFHVPIFPLPLESIHGNNLSSNVYTALRRYIQDYGYAGMMFVQYILGAVYGLAYLLLKNSKRNGLNIVLYATFFYPIVEIAIEERFFSDILSAATFIKLLSFLVFYKLLIQVKVQSEKI